MAAVVGGVQARGGEDQASPKIIKNKKTDRPLPKKEEKKVQISEVTKRVTLTRCRGPPLNRLEKPRNNLGIVCK